MVSCVSPAAGDAPDAALVTRCGDGICGLEESVGLCPSDCSPTEQVDILFVVDNSASMAPEQELLRAQLGALLKSMRSSTGALPDVHVGVVSTDVGAGAHPIAACDGPTGDGGALLVSHCAQPEVAPYLVDAAPRGCVLSRRPDATCEAYDCGEGACPEGQLVTDPATGCPRCRNFTGETLDSVFGCMVDLGTSGCGFEQPLESMRLALDANPVNHGFLRSGSVLVVLFVTDEDDCSARAGARIFDPAQTDMASELGPLTSFRCFEQSVVCDVNDRLAVGPRGACRLREDEGSLLVPVAEYVSFLRGLRDPGRLIVAAVAGPWDGTGVVVTRDPNGHPMVQPVCGVQGGGPVVPGFRLSSFVSRLHPSGAQPPWTYGSLCEAESFDRVLTQVGSRVTAVLQ